jgi:hypothetical protein
METIMSKTKRKLNDATTRELAEDELALVSGGDGTAERKSGNQGQALEFLKITMKHVTVSNVS